MLDYGIPGSKLVLGLALFGRTFKKYHTGHREVVEAGLSGEVPLFLI